MGDRIVINIAEGRNHTPSFYGHWCGLRAVKTINDLVRSGMDNGINNLLCNFIIVIMQGQPNPYSYYLFNYGECVGTADWDNFEWTFDVIKRTWTTTDPQFAGMELTIDEADDYVRKCRPSLFEGEVSSESRKGRSIFHRGGN